MGWFGSTRRVRRQVLEIVGTAVLYVLLARLGQLFAIDPGNVTPVWLPSGVMLALVALRGNYLLAGVFLGAFTGNAWAYLEFTSVEAAARGFTAGTLNGIGDVLCVMLGIVALGRAGGISGVFRRVGDIRRFLVLAVVLGPAVSALFGIGGLASMGFLPWSDAPFAFYTWLVGDSVGVLLLTPLILSYSDRAGDLFQGAAPTWERVLFFVVPLIPLATVGLAALDVEFDSTYLAAPLILWVLMRGGVRFALWAVVALVAVELVLTLWAESWGLPAVGLPVAGLQLLIGVTVSSLLFFATVVWQQERYLRVATEAATHDDLTGAWNRRALIDALDAALGGRRETDESVSLVMFDLDHFKATNDRLGHAAGDELLRAFTRQVQSELRADDVLARWGGDEYLLILSGRDAAAAGEIAERVRNAVAAALFVPSAPITVSAGVVEAGNGVGVDDLIDAADKALYEAKNEGRNRVCVRAEPISGTPDMSVGGPSA